MMRISANLGASYVRSYLSGDLATRYSRYTRCAPYYCVCYLLFSIYNFFLVSNLIKFSYLITVVQGQNPVDEKISGFFFGLFRLLSIEILFYLFLRCIMCPPPHPRPIHIDFAEKPTVHCTFVDLILILSRSIRRRST
jgi:hypothetical protein